MIKDTKWQVAYFCSVCIKELTLTEAYCCGVCPICGSYPMSGHKGAKRWVRTGKWYWAPWRGYYEYK